MNLAKIARKIVEYALEGKDYEIPDEIKEKLNYKAGAFTTIKTLDNQLRGCMGIPYPIYPLWQSLKYSALMAAFEDPRFPPLQKEELDNVKFEVTVLTPPRKLIVNNPLEYLEKIKIGKHGIIIKRGPYSGLLLPQVPIEEGWDAKEFLSYGCLKAGLPMDCWLDPKTEVYVFEGQIFEED
ncbi:NEQ441 [Nanoarchaeum equitans Kin4-M]|uniref:Protein NEQ441 n=1 Tax=Nanoarchaeum equitans (strain Kin4-M) TaxID=228908 RepID=Y441_NANEQ|nr:RecName: Full=Protein NEQ441 [Nanoarchaeum equitans Kin4-M]AAR39286.1 NEQ441 [Nanoarchaeum equitans Kin4-M]